MAGQTSYEMYERLLERQSTTRAERLALKSSLDIVDTKIKSLISHVKNRPRETDEMLVQRLRDVEVYHATHPQTNKEEREFMRELGRLKNKRKELVEYNVIQGEIDVLKSQRSSFQRDLKEKEACLDELYAGARKMRAAHKLNADPNALQEDSMVIPHDKIGFVVGPGGSNVKKMEDECFVCIDLDRGRGDASEGKLNLFYVPGHNDIIEAKKRIQVILDTRIEEWSISNEKVTCLLNKRAAIVMKIQEMYDVRIDISRAKLLCKVSGLFHNVESASTAINSLEVSSSKIELVERRVLSYLLGKGRPILQSLLDEHSVDIQLDKDSTPPTATVVGAKNSVVTVTKILKGVVEENKEIEDEMKFERHVVLDAVIGSKGVIISQLQRDFNVRLTVDKERVTADNQAIIEIKGNAMNVKTVKDHIRERVEAYQSDTVVVQVPQALLAGILGKKGARITALRQKHPAVTIDLTAETNSIRLHSTDPVERLSAVDDIEKYIAANMQEDFAMNKSTTITLKGGKGTDTRKHLIDILKLNIDIDTDGEVIHIRGRKPDIEQGVQVLTTFCDDNFELEMKCVQADAGSLLNGKEESISRVIESRYSVNIYYSRKHDTLRFVGQKDAVSDAHQFVEDFLDGNAENSALVSITSSGIGALVGRGGNNIKSFEKKHNVRVDILKPRDQVRVHGSSASEVEAAKLDLLAFLDNLIINVVIDELDTLWSNRCDSITMTLEELLQKAKNTFGAGMHRMVQAKRNQDGDDNEIDSKSGSRNSVTFFGTPRRANAAKEYVLDEISGVSTTILPLLPHHLECLSTEENRAKLEKSVSSANVSASLSDEAIVLKGPITSLPKATIHVNRLLDYCFTGEFSSVVADFRTLLMLWNFETELEFKNHVMGGHISFDMRMSCIRVYASTSISHTLGVEYIRNSISECKKRVAVIPVSPEVFATISSKKSVYFGPIETKYKCRLAVQHNKEDVEETNDEDVPKFSIVIEGPSESATEDAAAAMRDTTERLKKENWKTTLKDDIIRALIGKGGSHVKSLRQETRANINIDMRTCVVEVNGKEEYVNEAKERILQFVADRERESHVTYVPITPDCIPRIIGSKGAVIQKIRTESKVASIDINREENVVVIKGSEEAGLKAKEEIVALLLKDDINISNLHYVTPEERREKALKAEAARLEENKKRAAADKAAKAATAPIAGSKDEYLALLNRPGISKSAVRRIRRKLRDDEVDSDSFIGVKEESKVVDVDIPVSNKESELVLNMIIPVDEENNDTMVEVKQHDEVKKVSPSSVVIPTYDTFEKSDAVETSKETVAPPSFVPSTNPKKPVVIPQGAAGNILSMILGTAPVTNSANRLCSPRSMATGGNKHGAIGSVFKPSAINTPSATPATKYSQGRTSNGSTGTGTENVGASYYKSRTGRAIRLD